MGTVVKLQERSCPVCGHKYVAHPAISRFDNATLICPECGMRQALETIGITDAPAQDRVIEMAKNYERRMRK